MGEHPLQLHAWQHGNLLGKLTGQLRTDADPAHARIDLQMYPGRAIAAASRLCNCLSRLQGEYRLRDIVLHHAIRFLQRRRPQNEDWLGEACLPKLQCLTEHRYSQIRRSLLYGLARYGNRPMSIGIRLDHCTEPGSAMDALLDFLYIMFNGCQINFSPYCPFFHFVHS